MVSRNGSCTAPAADVSAERMLRDVARIVSPISTLAFRTSLKAMDQRGDAGLPDPVGPTNATDLTRGRTVKADVPWHGQSG